MNRLLAIVLVGATLFAFGGWTDEGRGLARAADSPPTCTNGDCYGPPVCTNGDCGPPSCTNGDCGDLAGCCCIGPNTPGTNRVCCCPSPNLDGITCRLSLVLDTDDYPDEWHLVLSQETLNGMRPRSCDILLARLCDPPEAEVCSNQSGKRVCTKMVKGICRVLETICVYRYCGPTWFPFDEPTPDKDGCDWWDRIYPCTQR